MTLPKSPPAAGRSSALAKTLRGLALSLMTPVLAVLGSLVVGSVVILLLGVNPLTAYSYLFSGAFGNLGQITTTLVNAVPLIFAGLAVALSFRASVFNIGGEGQLQMGALFAVWAGVYLNLPVGLHLLVALAFGALGGALWAAIPGYLMAKKGLNEVITTILMNYVAIQVVAYMVRYPLRAPGWNPQTDQILSTAKLPILISGTSLHAGLILALLVAVVVHILLNRTGLGFSIRMVGNNREGARYAGVNVAAVAIITMALSGALAGLAGATEILGVRYRLLEGFSPGWGFDAIAVALVGGLSAPGTVLGAIFFGALRAGANSMQAATGLSVVAIYFIQGLVVLFMIAGRSTDFFRKLVARRKEANAVGRDSPNTAVS